MQAVQNRDHTEIPKIRGDIEKYGFKQKFYQLII